MVCRVCPALLRSSQPMDRRGAASHSDLRSGSIHLGRAGPCTDLLRIEPAAHAWIPPLPISTPYHEVVAPILSSPLLDTPGAVAASGADVGVAWHYGDPMAEQRSAERSAALFDLSHRGLIAVAGPDRLTWLHTLTSQFLTGLPDGSATEALVLSPQGHVEHHLGVTEIDGVTYLDTEPSRAEALLAYLTSMVFWSKVEVRSAVHQQTIDLAQLRLVGPRAAEIAIGVGVLTADLEPARAIGLEAGGFAARSGKGLEIFLPRASIGRVADALVQAGGRLAGSWAAEALRIAARSPRIGLDTDERTIPNELPWLSSAVHLEKGCYRGQETVARVHNLGRPPRRLALLHLDGSVDRLPEPGDDLLTEAGRVVGRVGSSAHHHEDGPIALGLVKRSVSAGVPLLAGGVDAALDPDDEAVDSGPPVSAVDRKAFTGIRRR